MSAAQAPSTPLHAGRVHPGALARAFAAALLAGLAACSEGAGERPGQPEPTDAATPGTFARVGGVEIPYRDVQICAQHYRETMPAASANEHERVGLTAYLIPRAAFEALHPEARETARQRALARLEVLSAEGGHAPDSGSLLNQEATPDHAERRFEPAKRVAPPMWAALEELGSQATELEINGPLPLPEPADGAVGPQPVTPSPWVGPLEDTGSFVLLRLVGIQEEPRGYEFDVEEFFFRDREITRENYFDEVFSTKLELIDPDAREIIPRHWQIEMGASH